MEAARLTVHRPLTDLGRRLSRLKPAPMPRDPDLMLCELVAKPFNAKDWLFEPKLDGLRILCRCTKGSVKLISRNDKLQNHQFPDIVEALKSRFSHTALLDGEIVCLDSRGRTSFRKLQQRFHLLDPKTIAQRAAEHPAYLFAFDILYLDGRDLRPLPLSDRKRLLRDAIAWSDRIRYTPTTPEKGVELLADACRRGEEGIVAKHLPSAYTGNRSGAWLKIKCSGRQEFVIGGFTDPQRSRVGLGALLVGYYSKDARDFIYAGKVGTGYTREMLLDLRQRLDKLIRPTAPFTQGKPPGGPHVHWVRPKLVAEMGYAEWTQNDLLRQPRFEGLRDDKKPTAVQREQPVRAVKSPSPS
jgi:bifunctional non-homologous end joining protein LigD